MSPQAIVTRAINARFPGTCATCGARWKQGAPINYAPDAFVRPGARKAIAVVWCQACAMPNPLQPWNGTHDEPDQAQEPIQAPASQLFPSPVISAPVNPPKPKTNGADALDALALALQGRLNFPPSTPTVDVAQVERIANDAFNKGLPIIDERIRKLAEQTARATLDAAPKPEAPSIDLAAVEATAYEATRKAIADAQANGEDTSALAELPPVPALDPLYQDDNPTSAELRDCFARGAHTFTNGPSGSGKTFPIRMECAKAKRPVVELSAGDGIGYSHLIGSVTLERDAQGGIVTGWRDGALLRAMRAGAVFLLDEADQLPRPLVALLYGVLEPGRIAAIYVPEIGATVTAKPGFLVACTGNTVRDTSGQYSGERPSAALLNRMAHVPADYLSAKQEQAILQRVGLGERAARAIVASLAALRASYESGSLTASPSTRTGVQVARAMLGQRPDGSAMPAPVMLAPSKAWTRYLLGALPKQEADIARIAIEAAYRASQEAWS